MSRLPDLGVGLVYFAGLEHLLEAGAELIDVVEVEPETFWFRSDDGYRVHEAAYDRLRAMSQPKLLHGVGFPIGGTQPIDRSHLELFRSAAVDLGTPWVSEHLSFNRVALDGETFNPGFLLPPVQTPETVALAVRNIKGLAGELGVPFAFETGVSYLQPRGGEMSDGEFYAAIAEGADCGILLDLHNLWCNERNGRTPVAEVLASLPLERVVEMHVAGGQEYKGYWLDAHSDLVPSEVRALAEDLVPRLPALRAIVFEIMDDYVHARGIPTEALLDQLRWMRELWRTRGTASSSTVRRVRGASLGYSAPTALEWERALGSLVIGRAPEGRLAEQISSDPGLAITADLVRNVRAGMTVEALRLTYRYLVLGLGEDRAHGLMREFWHAHPPETFTLDEARRFLSFLGPRVPELPHLGAVGEYELAAQLVAMDGARRTVAFGADPLQILEPLGAGRLPTLEPDGSYLVDITG